MSQHPFTFHFLSLFPEQIRSSLVHGLMAKAEASGALAFRFHSIREHGLGKWKSVDDAPYGGGEGMVLRADVLDAAWSEARAEAAPEERVRTILLSPQGPKLTSARAQEWVERYDRLLLVSGHYEGVDERFIEERVDEECSIGDYVLTGGELPAAVLADVVGRRVKGVLGNAASVSEDSLEKGLLKYPQYTRPPEYRGRSVPEVLLSGDHAKVRAWREAERRRRTGSKRPDLLAASRAPLYIALLHDPVQNRRGEKVVSSVTNLDLHDLARSARTYGARGYFVVTPVEEQQELVGRILGHWSDPRAREAHPDRAEALSLIRVVSSFAEVRGAIRAECGEEAEVVFTDARPGAETLSYPAYREALERPQRTRPACIVFGTAWGLTEAFEQEADLRLDPVYGPEGEGGYNHLSVRAAVAVILDRLFGS